MPVSSLFPGMYHCMNDPKESHMLLFTSYLTHKNATRHRSSCSLTQGQLTEGQQAQEQCNNSHALACKNATHAPVDAEHASTSGYRKLSSSVRIGLTFAVSGQCAIFQLHVCLFVAGLSTIRLILCQSAICDSSHRLWSHPQTRTHFACSGHSILHRHVTIMCVSLSFGCFAHKL